MTTEELLMSTKKAQSKPLEIGDKLYRHVSMAGIWEYTVLGVRQYADNTQYEIRCEACTHGCEKCRLLIADNGKGVYKYVALLNNNGSDDDDDYSDDQSYWHNCMKYSTFHTDKYLAHIECYKNMLYDAKNDVLEAKKALKYKEDALAKLTDALKLAEDKYAVQFVEASK